MEKDGFQKALDRAKEIVESWPEWKRRDIFAPYTGVWPQEQVEPKKGQDDG